MGLLNILLGGDFIESLSKIVITIAMLIIVVVLLFFFKPLFLAIFLAGVSLFLIYMLPEEERQKYIYIPLLSAIIGLVLGVYTPLAVIPQYSMFGGTVTVNTDILLSIIGSGIILGWAIKDVLGEQHDTAILITLIILLGLSYIMGTGWILQILLSATLIFITAIIAKKHMT